jgi:predicted transcriptional regulator
MICPHCKREIDKNKLVEQQKKRILKELSKKEYTIASLSRKFSLNRSTTRYYLGLLKEQNMIFFDRQEKLPGRPTLIKLTGESKW